MLPIVDNSLTQTFAADIASLLGSFTESDGGAARRSLEQLRLSDPGAFARAAVRVLTSLEPSEGERYLLSLLSQSAMLVPPLADPDLCTREEAFHVAASAARATASFVQRLESHLSKLLDGPSGREATERIIRTMELLDRVGAKACWSALRHDLLDHPDDRVRATAAVLIVRNTKNASLAAKLMLNADPRVQANAIEGLWSLDTADTVPLFRAASKSKHARVAVNAALGLYKCADLGGIPLLLKMLEGQDEHLAAAAAWAMGHTLDPRFIPALERRYKEAASSLRFTIAKALAAIRRRQRELEECPLELRLLESTVSPDGSRRIAFATRPCPRFDPAQLRPTALALEESGKVVEAFTLKVPNSVRKLLLAVLVPRVAAKADLRSGHSADAIVRAASMLRHQDACRVDRYALEAADPESALSPGTSPFPYQESLMTPQVKSHRGFLNGRDVLAEIASTPGPKECSATDPFSALSRVVDAMGALGGERHAFLFLASDAQPMATSPEKIADLAERISRIGVVLHGMSESEAVEEEYRRLCLKSKGGTFSVVPPDRWAAELERTCMNLLGHFEVEYSGPALTDAAECSLSIFDCGGTGHLRFRLDPPPAEKATPAVS